MRWKTVATAWVVSTTLILLAFEFYVVVRNIWPEPKLPRLFGNSNAVRSTLRDDGLGEIRFAVVGDTKSTGTFSSLVAKLQTMPLDFAVLLGDCAHLGTEADHRFLRNQVRTRYALPYPTFFVAGNHDLDPQTFPVERFEEIYGPTVFSFEYKRSLFVFLRVLPAPDSNQESFEFLRSLDARELKKYHRRFVFMHVPPDVSESFSARKLERGEELVTLVRGLGIDYVFAGDYHGYARVDLDGTTYVVTGGGGGALDGRPGTEFHHGMIISVGEHGVTEKILPTNKSGRTGEQFERFAVSKAFPFLSRNRTAMIVLNALLVLLTLARVWTSWGGPPIRKGWIPRMPVLPPQEVIQRNVPARKASNA